MIQAKQYLNQIKRLDNLINTKQHELETLKSMLTNITVPLQQDRVQSNGAGDTIGNTVAKIVDLQNEINEQIDRFVDSRAKIVKQIDMIQNPDFHKLLYLRYLQYKTWNQIAEELSHKDDPFSLQWVHTMHGRALQEFQKIIEKSLIVD